MCFSFWHWKRNERGDSKRTICFERPKVNKRNHSTVNSYTTIKTLWLITWWVYLTMHRSITLFRHGHLLPKKMIVYPSAPLKLVSNPRSSPLVINTSAHYRPLSPYSSTIMLHITVNLLSSVSCTELIMCSWAEGGKSRLNPTSEQWLFLAGDAYKTPQPSLKQILLK